MKRSFCWIAVLGLCLSLSTSSCNRGVGCPANESAHVKPGKNGELPTSGGYTRLFPKDFNKKSKQKKN